MAPYTSWRSVHTKVNKFMASHLVQESTVAMLPNNCGQFGWIAHVASQALPLPAQLDWSILVYKRMQIVYSIMPRNPDCRHSCGRRLWLSIDCYHSSFPLWSSRASTTQSYWRTTSRPMASIQWLYIDRQLSQLWDARWMGLPAESMPLLTNRRVTRVNEVMSRNVVNSLNILRRNSVCKIGQLTMLRPRQRKHPPQNYQAHGDVPGTPSQIPGTPSIRGVCVNTRQYDMPMSNTTWRWHGSWRRSSEGSFTLRTSRLSRCFGRLRLFVTASIRLASTVKYVANLNVKATDSKNSPAWKNQIRKFWPDPTSCGL